MKQSVKTMKQRIAKLSKMYPCREEYFTELYRLFNNDLERYPPSLYIHGPAGIGKTTLLKHFLNTADIRYAFIDGIAYYTPRMLFEEIINAFVGHKISSANNFENYAKCDNMEDFIEQLNSLSNNRPYILILKNHERIQSMDKNILPVFMRFNQVALKYNMCCVLIGCRPFRQSGSMQTLPETIEIHCAQYNKAELTTILQTQQKFLRQQLMRVFVNGAVAMDYILDKKRTDIIKSLESEFFTGYFNVFLSMFYTVCRNVRELLYLSNEHFAAYCRPIIEEAADPNDMRKLWKNMEAPFQRAMSSIYCRMEFSQVEN